jgi:tRNA A-37 threonylcarbamoyl transferase component Bud32
MNNFDNFKNNKNINLKLLKNCLELTDIKNNLTFFINLFNNSTNEEIINYIEIIKYIINKNLIEKEDIKMLNINNKISDYVDNKYIYSELKSLNILCNKYVNNNNKINEKKSFDSILNAIQCTTNIKRINFYVNKLLIYFNKYNCNNFNHSKLINVIENIIYNEKIIKNTNIESFLNLINKCKKESNMKKNELEDILIKLDNGIHKYIYFLNNLYYDKNSILTFVLKLGYENEDIKEIDNLNLKRGFIKGLKKGDMNYILKYQPNKSFMELVINCYLKSFDKEKNNYFLIPELLFINNDNSYFYIIEKYKTDLYKYFNILDKNSKILQISDVINIINFLVNAIEILHNNNIIHADLKLENIVINVDENNNINNLKIIDFDVSLFNIIPDKLFNVDNNKYIKILNNKKLRGTRIYMLKDKLMTFSNDIYSIGVIILIILYKNTKLYLFSKKKNLNLNLESDKKIIIKYQNIIKEMNDLRDKIEDDKIKLELLDLIYKYYMKNIIDLNKNKLKYIKDFIIKCILDRPTIIDLKNKFNNHFIV